LSIHFAGAAEIERAMDRLNETDGVGASGASARAGSESTEAGVADAFALDPRATLNRLRAVVYDWDIVSDRLAWGPNAAETLAALEEDQYLVVSAKRGWAYVQFAAQGSFGLRAECVSNNYLDEAHALSACQRARLRKMGWSSPRKTESPNFFRDFDRPVPCADAARMAVRALTEVFEIPHPGSLMYKAFDKKDRTILVLDIFELAGAARPEWVQQVAPPAAAGSVAGRVPTVLVAEDSDFFRGQIQRLVEAVGCRVLAAEDGQEAWELLDQHAGEVDMLATDVEMPRMDGLALTRRIRADGRFAELPIIALSSMAGEEEIARGMAAGVNEYQIKINKDELIESIRKAVHRSGNAPAVQQLSGN